MLYTVVRFSHRLNLDRLLTVPQDKCQELEVSGWPQLDLYQDGKLVGTFNKARELNLLKEYLDKYLVADAHPPSPPVPKAPTRISNPEGKILGLDERNFSNEVKQGGVFVKFFAPWCGHCKKLAPTWTQLAEQMRNQLTIAEVNCDEHNALCRTEDVQGYPMLFYYGDGGVKTEYTGGRKLEQLQAFVEKVLKPQATSFCSFQPPNDITVGLWKKSGLRNSTNSSKSTKFYICSCTRRQTPTPRYVFL